MADHEPDHDALVERLRALGEHPIDPALQAAHLTAMSAPRPAGIRPKLRVAAAFLAGLLVGGSGLAVAGALPDPAQNLAHRAFKQAGIEVPQPERYHDDAECGPEVMANHGGYVRADRSKAQTECGKRVKGARGGPGERGANDPEGAGPAERGPCQGPPPWATDPSLSPEAKATAQAERRAACGDDGEIDEAEDAGETERSSGGSPPVDVPADPTTTTTTAPTATTTTTSTTATTSDVTTTTAG